MASVVGANIPSGLEHSGPVFDRARRLARTLFGDVEASVVLVSAHDAWRSHDSDARGPEDSPIACMAVAQGSLQWIADASRDPRTRELYATATGPFRPFCAAAPIRLED